MIWFINKTIYRFYNWRILQKYTSCLKCLMEGRTVLVNPSVVGVSGRGSVRVVVVGGKGVGKSALTVRFLTKRYIGEYQSTTGNSVVSILRGANFGN